MIVQKQQQYVTGSRKLLGSEFQNIGPATEKARRPYVASRWDGITSWWPAPERRCCLEAVVETGMQHAARYRGAEPYRHRRVITPSLYSTRSGTSSQWSSVCICNVMQTQEHVICHCPLSDHVQSHFVVVPFSNIADLFDSTEVDAVCRVCHLIMTFYGRNFHFSCVILMHAQCLLSLVIVIIR